MRESTTLLLVQEALVGKFKSCCCLMIDSYWTTVVDISMFSCCCDSIGANLDVTTSISEGSMTIQFTLFTQN